MSFAIPSENNTIDPSSVFTGGISTSSDELIDSNSYLSARNAFNELRQCMQQQQDAQRRFFRVSKMHQVSLYQKAKDLFSSMILMLQNTRSKSCIKLQEEKAQLIHQYLEIEHSVNPQGYCRGIELLYWAVSMGDVDMVTALIKNGIEVNFQLEGRESVLNMAVKSGKVELVRALISGGAWINQFDSQGFTPLMCAVKQGHRELVSVLIDAGADTQLNSSSAAPFCPMCNAMHIAIVYDRHDIICDLLKVGGEMNFSSFLSYLDDNFSTLSSSQASSQRQSPQTTSDDPSYLNYGELSEDLSSINSSIHVHENPLFQKSILKGKNTPIMLSIQSGQTKAVYQLIAAGADLNTANLLGNTPLLLALKNNNLQVAEALIKAQANPNASDLSGHTALMLAAEKGFENIVEKLLSAGALVNQKRKDGKTALHLAADNQQLRVASELLDHGADCFVCDTDGNDNINFVILNDLCNLCDF